MNRIRLLPEQVANQIAAGEVVERPASVVKELVENSLDAQSSKIVVEIQAGGRSFIRVSDDGRGMSRDDALLCLERHATSKIRTAGDLSTISTMGFRGEALPSIASVSRFTLTTREREDANEAATRVVLSGGKILEVKEASGTPGTAVEVRQLFFNLPARRKFMRGEETERAHIQHYLTLAALAYPEVGFIFMSDSRLVWQLPAIPLIEQPGSRLEPLRERLRVLYGAELQLLSVDCATTLEDLVPADASDSSEEVSVRVWGFIGAPGLSRASRQDQHLFVNRRPVDNRGLNYALLEGYHTALMKGRYPVCCLFLEIDPGEVDVNIHPAKREIKFHREGEVRQFVAKAVRETLVAYHGLPAVEPAPSKIAATENAPVRKPIPDETRDHQNLPPPPASEVSAAARGPQQAPSWSPRLSAAPEPASIRAASPPPAAWSLPSELETPPSKALSQEGMERIGAVAEAVPLLRVPLRLVGVVGKLYVVLESDRGLVLLDQHAAHERILFEQMLRRLEQGNAPSQRLLLPETIELPPRDVPFLREQLETLTRLGVGLSEFGERTFLLDALPPFVKVSDARRFMLRLVDELKAAGQGINSLRLGEETVTKTVCRHAVKANDALAGPELENLINDLRHCAMPYTCPHGRPTLIEMNFRELEKKFGRIQ